MKGTLMAESPRVVGKYTQDNDCLDITPNYLEVLGLFKQRMSLPPGGVLRHTYKSYENRPGNVSLEERMHSLEQGSVLSARSTNTTDPCTLPNYSSLDTSESRKIQKRNKLPNPLKDYVECRRKGLNPRKSGLCCRGSNKKGFVEESPRSNISHPLCPNEEHDFNREKIVTQGFLYGPSAVNAVSGFGTQKSAQVNLDAFKWEKMSPRTRYMWSVHWSGQGRSNPNQHVNKAKVPPSIQQLLTSSNSYDKTSSAMGDAGRRGIKDDFFEHYHQLRKLISRERQQYEMDDDVEKEIQTPENTFSLRRNILMEQEFKFTNPKVNTLINAAGDNKGINSGRESNKIISKKYLVNAKGKPKRETGYVDSIPSSSPKCVPLLPLVKSIIPRQQLHKFLDDTKPTTNHVRRGFIMPKQKGMKPAECNRFGLQIQNLIIQRNKSRSKPRKVLKRSKRFRGRKGKSKKKSKKTTKPMTPQPLDMRPRGPKIEGITFNKKSCKGCFPVLPSTLIRTAVLPFPSPKFAHTI